MKVLVDIAHPAHVNFLKHAMNILKNEGHEIMITGLKRGKLPKILEKEMSQYPISYVGSHNGSTYSIIVEANLKKAFNLAAYVIRHKVDIGVSVGSFNLGAVLKLIGKPNLQFDDDPERKTNVFLEKMTSTALFFPPIISADGNVKVMNALKEWAYLTPKYFKPSVTALMDYPVKTKEYIFVREVSTGSLNYQDQQSNLVASISGQFPENYQVLLSLEDKKTKDQYPSDWIILEEPVGDIHSLMYFSKIIVSSGDSMAREGAMLGVPSIYCGSREMKANQLLIDRKMLFKSDPAKVPALMENLVNQDIMIMPQESFRERLMEEWVDVTEFIVNNIKYYSLPANT
ncbi:MAG: DUF354 domain-containing protein [Candidatus Cyclobacteriaceae bacterium M3_2C_046]